MRLLAEMQNAEITQHLYTGGEEGRRGREERKGGGGESRREEKEGGVMIMMQHLQKGGTFWSRRCWRCG